MLSKTGVSQKSFTRSVLIAFVLAITGGLIGCGDHVDVDHNSDYVIGNPVQSISSLSAPDGAQAQAVVIFDKMLRRIHQFDLGAMTAIKSFAVRNPEEEHFVVNCKDGNYIIDLSLKGLTVFNKYNQANYNPIRFQGKPRATFFDSNSGVFGIYDDQMTVGLMQLDPNGEVINHKTLGAAVIPNSSAAISAGDIDSSGHLILALSNGTIAVIDSVATMAGVGNNSVGWSLVKPVPFATGLSDIMWLAPLPLTPGGNQLVLVRSSTTVSIIDTVSETVLQSYTIDGRVEKVSKFSDPHLVIRKDNKITVVYARAGVLETKEFLLNSAGDSVNSILSSNLNIAKDSWSFVDSTVRFQSIFNDLEVTHSNRRFKRYSLAARICTHNLAIQEEPQVEISDNFIFGLFKDELGYAERTNVDTEEVKTVKLFNLHYIPAH